MHTRYASCKNQPESASGSRSSRRRFSLSHCRHLGWPWRDDPPTAATRGLRRIRCVATMNVELVAPDRKIWSGEAEMVIARTTDGDIGILPGHEPTLGVLVESPVRIKRSGEDELVAAVHGGFLSVTRDSVSVLAEVVELRDEIDTGRARQALERSQGAEDDDDAKAAGRRAAARLRAAGENV